MMSHNKKTFDIVSEEFHDRHDNGQPIFNPLPDSNSLIEWHDRLENGLFRRRKW